MKILAKNEISKMALLLPSWHGSIKCNLFPLQPTHLSTQILPRTQTAEPKLVQTIEPHLLNQ